MPKLKHRTVMPRPDDRNIIDAYANAVGSPPVGIV